MCQKDWTCPGWVGELKQGSDRRIGAIESEEKHLRLRVKELICSILNGMRRRQSLPQPCIPWRGRQTPWTVQWLGAGAEGLRSIPRRGLPLPAERPVEGCGGRTLWWTAVPLPCLSHTADPCVGVEPSPQPPSLIAPALAAEQQRCWRVKRLMLNYRAGPHPGGPFE